MIDDLDKVVSVTLRYQIESDAVTAAVATSGDGTMATPWLATPSAPT